MQTMNAQTSMRIRSLLNAFGFFSLFEEMYQLHLSHAKNKIFTRD